MISFEVVTNFNIAASSLFWPGSRAGWFTHQRDYAAMRLTSNPQLSAISLTTKPDAEMAIHLDELERQLTPLEKKVFLGLKIYGLSVAEMAHELDLSVDAVKSISYRCRKKIREYFS